MMIFVIDDDVIMGKCIAKACDGALGGGAGSGGAGGDEGNGAGSGGDGGNGDGDADVRIFTNAIEAMAAIGNGVMPDLVFLDVLLDGPDGFTMLNEMMSYEDTAKIPIVIMSSLELTGQDLSAYGVVGVLPKETMTPEEIGGYVEKYAK